MGVEVLREEEEEEEEEGGNFVSRLEVLHVLMAHGVIPMGVGEGDIGMDEHAEGVEEGLGNPMWNLMTLSTLSNLFHLISLLMDWKSL